MTHFLRLLLVLCVAFVAARLIVNVGAAQEPVKAKSVQYTAPAATRTRTGT